MQKEPLRNSNVSLRKKGEPKDKKQDEAKRAGVSETASHKISLESEGA